jgi:hypothetical protein
MADAHVGQQGTLTRIWAKRGTRHRATRDTRYQWAFAGSLEPVAFTGSLLGAVCPARGAAVGLVLPFVSTEAMNAHLAEISRNVAAFVGKTIPRMVLFPSSPHAMLILGGAGWHGANALVVPDNLSLLTLPPYSPELNPVENIWQYLRANWLAISVFESYGAIVDACCAAWNRFADDPKTVTSITSRAWAQVS